MPSPDHVLQIRITLLHPRQTIWRRIEVLDDTSFWTLHMAIQDAMGWQDKHGHMFEQFEEDEDRMNEAIDRFSKDFGDLLGVDVDDDEFEDADEPEEPMLIGVPWAETEDAAPGWVVPITSVLTLAERRVRYTYDLEAVWEHEILLEQIRPLAKDESPADYPRCIDGERACPLEDMPSPYEWDELLEDHAAGKSVARFFPGPKGKEQAARFDPAAFDPAAVRFQDPDARLKRILKRIGR